MRIWFPIAVLLTAAACNGHASNRDKLDAAANQSTPEAAQVLKGAAQNGMDANAAINQAAAAQAGNDSSPAPGESRHSH